MHSLRFLQSLCYVMLLISVTGCCCLGPAPMRAARVVQPTAMSGWDDWWRGSRQSERNCVSSCVDGRQQDRGLAAVQSPLVLGESAYIVAERLHADCDERAVDYWAQAIAWTAEAMRQDDCTCCAQSCVSTHGMCSRKGNFRAAQIHRSAMIRILSQGQFYGRLDPSSHLLINGEYQTLRIPVFHHGFAWQRSDFQRLLVLTPLASAPGNVEGRGVPLIVLSRRKSSEREVPTSCGEHHDDINANIDDNAFVDSQTPFAATALMNIPLSLFQDVAVSGDDRVSRADVGSVTLINPLVIDPGTNGGLDDGPAIAQCPSMPLNYARQASEYNPLTAFLSGDNGIDRPRLRFFEPYQSDKIPLILVHGLLSDPATFLQMADAVRADSFIRNRYQIWVFRYPTGDNVLNSAAALRSQLARAFARRTDGLNPSQNEELRNAVYDSPPLQGAVIVGHSMGGLVSKLQVTDSGDRLWRSIADVPIDQMRGSSELLNQMQQSFFFPSNPNIGRVVYIATPHQGSQWASRCIGRLGSTLAGVLGQGRNDYAAIVRNNPGVFSGEYSEAFPSSVELLRPSSRLLQAIGAAPSSPTTVVDSIIGDSCWLPRSGPSDGVVSVTSAYRANAESTNLVDATHTRILQSAAAQQTLLEILRVHLATPAVTNHELPIESPLVMEAPLEMESPLESKSLIEVERPLELELPRGLETSLELLPALP